LEKRIRKPNRLREYDYSREGIYFITICTHNREPILSEIVRQPLAGGETLPLRRCDDDEWKNAGGWFPVLFSGARFCADPVSKFELTPVPHLQSAGCIVQEYLNHLHEKYPAIYVDDYVIMPNHIHVLLGIRGNFENENGTGNSIGTGNPSPTTTALGNVIGWFKYQTTKEINKILGTTGMRIWQRSYYDHIIRSDEDYWHIRQYIEENPARWVEKYNG